MNPFLCSSFSRPASPFLPASPLGTESFMGGTSAVYHATSGEGTTELACYLFIHSYSQSYSVYRKWVCGAAAAEALSSLCYFNRPVLLTQSNRQRPKLPQMQESAEPRQVLGNIHCVFTHCKILYMCWSVCVKEKWSN